MCFYNRIYTNVLPNISMIAKLRSAAHLYWSKEQEERPEEDSFDIRRKKEQTLKSSDIVLNS